MNLIAFGYRCVGFLYIAAFAIPATANLIVNGNFQTNSLTPSTSGYSLSPNMQSAGTWNIVTSDTIHPAWVDMVDHTFGNASGKFMVVNGASTPEGKAWAQTVIVTPNTYYQLSAWFANLHAPSNPAPLNYRIMNGASTLASRFLTSNAVAGLWGDRNMTFYTGAATSVSVEIWDTNAFISSRDYAIDDISLNVLGAPDDVGDYDHGGTIDTGDYVFWRKKEGSAEQRLAWVRYFDPTGQVLFSGSGGTVPEPAAMMFAFFGLAAFIGRPSAGRR